MARVRKAKRRAFVCGKCGHRKADPGEMRTSAGTLTALVDIDSRRYAYLACRRCGYTEFYQRQADTAFKLFDFLLG
jgi:predicted nucleic-acid-binding Zn-ribbon protein